MTAAAPDDDDEAAELRRRQDRRAAREQALADEDPTKAGTAKHKRRADKAEYLAEKLREREQAEGRE